MDKPLVAIVGRPNVGKSTLFNRIVGERIAIVEDIPGTTRDRLYFDAEWNGNVFTLVDTGGIDLAPESDLIADVRSQAELAIEEADVIVFVVDAKDGITQLDLDIADQLRLAKKPVLVAANKADNPKRRMDAYEFHELGLGTPIDLSALHGVGTGDLLSEIVENLPTFVAEEETEMVKVAIVGRPNVGKSSLLNALLGTERVIVSEVPGTTRDAIDTVLQHEGKPVLVIDTAGIRRRGKIEVGIERYSVMRALRAINRADIVLLIVDATEPVTAQDTHIAGFIRDAYKGVVVVVNKWDLIAKTGTTTVEYTAYIRDQLKFMPYVPILFVSAKSKQRVDRILPEVIKVQDERKKRIPTGVLNTAIAEALASHNPPSERGKKLKIYYTTQATICPPEFVFFVNDYKLVHFSYERFLENRIRESFGFEGTPIRLVFRNRGKE